MSDFTPITQEVMASPANLLEYVALTICRKVKSAYPDVGKVAVKVSKFNPPIEGTVKCASVSVEL